MSPSPATTGPRRFLAIGLLPLAGILAAACSSGTGSATPTTNATATTAPSTPATTAGPQAVVKTMTVSGLGSILVNAQGQVLYSFTTSSGADAPCSSSCLAVWPAVTLPTGVTTPTGSSGVGTLATTTSNGPTQVTVNGLALYTFAGDSGPGVAKGNNLTSFGGLWKVVKAQ
jgi:predicted lipoprotein with Yx(FWY)xxD motif